VRNKLEKIEIDLNVSESRPQAGGEGYLTAALVVGTLSTRALCFSGLFNQVVAALRVDGGARRD